MEKAFVVNVDLLVMAEFPEEVADSLSGLLSENCSRYNPHSELLDWEYTGGRQEVTLREAEVSSEYEEGSMPESKAKMLLGFEREMGQCEKMTRLAQFGCAVALFVDGTIKSVPLLATGALDFENCCEVTAPTQGFLDAVNEAFKTSYALSQFAGR